MSPTRVISQNEPMNILDQESSQPLAEAFTSGRDLRFKF